MGIVINKAAKVFIFGGLISMLTGSLYAQSPEAKTEADTTAQHKQPRFNLHFQTTYIYQYKPEFSAKYSGPNSLSNLEEKENSLTATLYLGARLWKGGELYINPEVAGGSGLSGAFGLGASTNGETFRVGDPAPTLYLGRGYLKQTFALGAGKKANDNNFADDAENQLSVYEPKDFIRFYLGKLSLADIFDVNAYANSPRTQFMNWCLMNNGAYDYAANVRGYTYAFITVLQKGKMTYKAALATLPTTANGSDLNTDLSEEYSIDVEVDRSFTINKLPGNLRLLGYYNNGHMGEYAQAIKYPDTSGLPNVITTRRFGRSKTGVSLNADQQLTYILGLFARAGWNDGNTETWAFTEADRSLSAGLSLSGTKWKRSDDVIGLAFDVNGLSANHRKYLAAGGMGFQLGDGKLSYANETAIELFYSYKWARTNIWLTGDYQFILNPGYNSDRGPVNVFSFRLHMEL
jgi:high affinity Mn2+ porin